MQVGCRFPLVFTDLSNLLEFRHRTADILRDNGRDKEEDAGDEA